MVDYIQAQWKESLPRKTGDTSGPVPVKKSGRKRLSCPDKERRSNFQGRLSITCPRHPRAANWHAVRACIYCLQTCPGKQHKDKQRLPVISLNLKGNSTGTEFSSNIEDVQTFKTEAAGADVGTVEVCFIFIYVFKLIN